MPVALWVWLGLLVLFIIAEAATAALVSVWFMAGAIVAAVAAGFGAPVWLQIVLFVVVSGVAMLIFRPYIKKKITPEITPTNADMVIGKEVIVKETVDNTLGTGRVLVGGQIWTARSYYGDVIQEDGRAVIYAIDGVKLIVVPVKEENL